MNETIELIDPAVILRYPDKMRLIEYWAAATDRPLGWHYWLDFIWILNNLEKAGCLPGARIIDAGAGNGLLQFIMASLGYNVVSLDFAKRDVPVFAGAIFDIKKSGYCPSGIVHPYKDFIKHTAAPAGFRGKKIARVFAHPVRGMKNLWFNTIAPFMRYPMWREVIKSRLGRTGYGTITYVTDDFTKLGSVETASADAVVSVSALEHSDHDGIARAVTQFSRVLKDGGEMFITVSAAKGKDRFFEPCRGWCFCESSLRTVFGLPTASSNFSEYDRLFEALRSSDEVKRRVDRYYFETGESGLPWGIYDPQYHPVGIIKTK